MKIKDGYIMRKVADVRMVVPIGDAVVDFNGMITLNDTAAFMWENLTDEITEEELVERIIKEYDVDKETAKNDTHEFIEKLRKSNII